MKRYRDSIHRDIHLSNLAVDIIDTPEFQKMDRIRQLGYSVYAFRGAKHTRFEHLVGAYHLAMKIFDYVLVNQDPDNMPDRLFPFEKLGPALGQTKSDKIRNVRTIVGIAALLHDITHIPHGHSLEDEYNEFYVKHDDMASLRLYHLLFDSRSGIAKVFSRERPYVPPLSNNELRRLLFVVLKHRIDLGPSRITNFEQLVKDAQGKNLNNKDIQTMLGQLLKDYADFSKADVYHPFMSDIFSNTICADLLDYLPRDAHGTGLEVAIDPRIFEYFIVASDTWRKELRLVIRVRDPKGIERDDVLRAIVKIMDERNNLAGTVYYHKAKVSAVSMLANILAETGHPPDTNPYDDKDSILKMDDQDLLEWARNKSKGKPETDEMIDMLENRRLYKPVLIIPYHVALRENLYLSIVDKLREGRDASANRRRIQSNLTKLTGKHGHKVIVYCPSAKMQAKEVDTLVMLGPDSVVPMKVQVANLSVAKDLEHQGEKYKSLWKLFLFMHPDDAQDEFLVSDVVTEFCKEIGLDIETARDLVPWGRFKTSSELRSASLHRWSREPAISVLPIEVVRQVEEVVRDEGKWASIVPKESQSPASAQGYDRCFAMIYELITLRKNRDHAIRLPPALPSGTKIRRDQIEAFAAEEEVRILQKPDLSNFIGTASRSAKNVTPQHFELFETKLTEYLKERAKGRNETLVPDSSQ